MTKLEQKLLQLGYNRSRFRDNFYYKHTKCIIWICLTPDKKQIQLTSIDYQVLATTRADGINAENQLQSDLKELELCQNADNANI